MPGAKVLKRQSNKIEKKVNAVTTNVAKHPKWNGAVLEATTQKRAFNGTIKDHIPASSNITKAVTQVDVGEVTADGGYSAIKKTEKARQISFLEENALNKYRSFNTIFTLAALNFYEVNFPEVLLERGPAHIVAKSGGGGKRVTSAVGMGMDGDLELFIDNVNIDAIVAPTPKNKHTQATGISFNIIEPYSMGKFLETLHLAAMVANNDDGTKSTNYFNSPYALIIDFKGENDAIQLGYGKDEGALR